MELGLGTWQNTDPETCRKSVKYAINNGYRHIDTAQIYRNEEYVGKGIEDSKKKREEIFLASKVWTENLSPEKVKISTKESLEKLGTDYIDLMYVHWPAEEYQAEETLNAFSELVDKGFIDKIGVSNFTPQQLKEALSHADLYANQVEMHPLLPQKQLRKVCEENDVELVAYSPLARGKVMKIDEIQAIAEKHGVSEAQVSLAWIMDKGATPIPKASTKNHIDDNLSSLNLELDGEDIEKIDSIDRRERMVDPEFSPW